MPGDIVARSKPFSAKFTVGWVLKVTLYSPGQGTTHRSSLPVPPPAFGLLKLIPPPPLQPAHWTHARCPPLCGVRCLVEARAGR